MRIINKNFECNQLHPGTHRLSINNLLDSVLSYLGKLGVKWQTNEDPTGISRYYCDKGFILPDVSVSSATLSSTWYLNTVYYKYHGIRLLSYIACKSIKEKVPTHFICLHELDRAAYYFCFQYEFSTPFAWMWITGGQKNSPFPA